MATRKQETTAETGAKQPRSRKAAASPETGEANGKVQGGRAPSKAAAAPAAAAPAAGSRPPAKRGRSAPAEPDVRSELRRFAATHFHGWGHGEWEDLVGELTRSGYDTTDRDQLGLALERERLDMVLQKIQGLGEKRRQAIVERYPRLWELQQASVEDVAGLGGLNRSLAEKVFQHIRSGSW